MKRRIVVSLGSVLLVSLVLAAGVAWAQVTWIPIEGTQTAETLDPGEQWMDNEGVLHIRDMVNLSTAQGQDVNGVPWTAVGTMELDINMNLATGTGDLIGHTQRDHTYGGLLGAFGGIITATSAEYAWTWIGEANFPHGSGDFAGWKLQGNFSHVWAEDTVYIEGFFKIPPGGGGDKAVPAESNTWGSVKALYR